MSPPDATARAGEAGAGSVGSWSLRTHAYPKAELEAPG